MCPAHLKITGTSANASDARASLLRADAILGGMFEDELAGRSVLLQSAVGLGHAYDIRRDDASGIGENDAIGTVSRGTQIAGHAGLHVSAGDQRILDFGRPTSASPHAVHPVVGGADETLGNFQRDSVTHLCYLIENAEGQPVATAERRSPALGVLRSFLNRFFLEWIPLPFRFVFLADGSEIGSFQRVMKLRRRYALDLSGDPDRKVDPRLVLALAIDLAERDGD